ncbi:hypothetical protein C1E30_09870 [Salmonella enterica subsp. enterica serovar Kentucky]|nr:hypothetical protein [Salmonella enterica subsp. enterica serovar Kentucky]ECT5321759.1 hypothetical protein [Salmonella enterica subsp. enterica serovar Kentucky]ECU2506422.1 hypothetical protein [Salmonella enterica subsp. enterica serovar Kentucky]ECV0804811.1 hypothetical protein [Salmonella enterica subsp. enterica serovar Kentucky]EDO4049716.1 hypothetical protein [Salmonella enterica subsp. enterica serovar Kentucky]
MSKNGYMPCHREKDGKLQIEVITNDYSFWMNAKESITYHILSLPLAMRLKDERRNAACLFLLMMLSVT